MRSPWLGRFAVLILFALVILVIGALRPEHGSASMSSMSSMSGTSSGGLSANSAIAAPSDRPLAEPTGIPAIRPPVNRTSVQNYVLHNRLWHNIASNQNTTIITIAQFSTMSDAGVLCNCMGGVHTGIPVSTSGFYVELSGTFVFAGPPGMTSATYTKAFEIFSATSGNLLLLGSLPS